MNTKLLFVTEARLVSDAQGRIYSPDGVNGDQQWSDYLGRDRSVTLAARVQPTRDVPPVKPIETIDVIPLAHYAGISGFLRALPRLVPLLTRAISSCDVVVVRVPGLLGYLAAATAWLRGKGYAAEVVGDPLDVLHALHGTSAIGRAGARIAELLLRGLTSRAGAVRYVTASVLQRRYPSKLGAPVASISNVILEESAFSQSPGWMNDGEVLRILVIGSQNNRYKGHDTALRVLKELQRSRTSELTLIGDGLLHDEYRALSRALGVESSVRFLGHMTDRRSVQAEIDRCHVLLHPSRTEGLPRVVLEAQARSRPVVGANVGGIPELVATRFLVAPEHVEGYVQALRSLSGNQSTYASEANRGYQLARGFHREIRRNNFKRWGDILERLA